MASFFSISNLFLQYSFLLFLLSYLLFHSSGFQLHPLCRVGDRSSLLQFKQSFVFDKFSCDPSTNYTKLDSWKVGSDCCSWDGVECDEETGHVIGLDLSRNCLYGSINSSNPLFRLLHLTKLNLSSNNFNLSRIPPGIGNLSKLTHLDLTLSNFYGQIPSEVLQLPQLVSLDLSLNWLMLQKPSLKDLVETLTNLTQLHLNFVTISSPVPHSLANLTSLSSLALANCSLQGEFPPSVFQLPNLRVLNLGYNSYLSGYLPEFQAGSPLETLGLDSTNFSGQIPVSIGNLKSLSFFSADLCHFGGLIPSSIGNLTKLRTLELRENNFTGKIPSSLGNLFQLTYLRLSYNNFSPGTLHWLGNLTNLNILVLAKTNSYGPIPSSLANLTRLQVLGLLKNQLTGQIPHWLGNLTRLWALSLSNNELQGPVPESIFQLQDLQDLDLQFNNLSGSLRFDFVLQLKHLFSFQVTANHLSVITSPYINATLPKFQFLGLGECNLKEFPAFLRGQNELKFLELASNRIEGYVPNWISTLESLTYLSMPNNSLTGFEQAFSFLSLPNLHFLDLRYNEFKGPLPIPPLPISIYRVSHNKFSGDISPLFCNLPSVVEFDLSSNNVSGSLPPCLGKFAFVVDLRNNSLSGEVPNKFTSECTLKVVDFSQNKIEGKIPTSLANCSNLEILNLEENQMNDVFPSWLGMLPRLTALSLKSNKFHGAIAKPLSKFEFGRLQIIDLSNNHFTGNLPLEYIQNWVSMKHVDDTQLAYMHTNTSFQASNISYTDRYVYSIRITTKGTNRENLIREFSVVIDLSSNRFEGEVPEVIGNLRELQSLNLSNNILTGQIPTTLANLVKLEALDLSVNRLSGQIPVQLSLLTFLSIFNVSQNNLEGPIPQGNQFDTFDNDSFTANPRLCGHPLSRNCGNTKTLPLPPSQDEDSDSPFEFTWKIVLIGFGSGLVIGVAYGYAIDTRKYEWLVKKKFAKWHRRRYRNLKK